MRRVALPGWCALLTLAGCGETAPEAPADTGADVAATESAVDAPDDTTPDDTTPHDAPTQDAPTQDAPDDTAGSDAPPDAPDDAASDAPDDAPDDAASDVPDDAADSGVAPSTEWVGVVGTGQSLSVGAAASRVINTRQPYNNLKLSDTGSVPLYDGTGDRLSVVPLVEPIRAGLTGAGYPGAPLYPTNIIGETPHTSMADEITSLSRALRGSDYVTVHSVVGESGRSITSIQRMGTGRAYASTLYEAQSLAALARTAGRTFRYGAIILTHGETDTARATYGADIFQLYNDYNRDLPLITGQRTRIPMLLSQQSAFPNTMGRSLSTQAQWRAGVEHPGEMICVGPKYQYEYASDRVHFDAYGYQRLGIKYAQVFYEVVVRGRAWSPLEPTAVRRAGRVITVDFFVPVAPLAWEETLAPPHQTALTEWAMGRGFEVESAAGRQRIESVRIVGSSVEITLAAPPAGANLTVRYAMSQDAAAYAGGLATGRRGLLRDSDPFVGIDRTTISARVTMGSTTVTGVAASAFLNRGVHDRVTGAGLMTEAAVMTRTDAAVTLSTPWRGATGEAPLTFFSDQRNYCVQFELAVP